MTRPPTRRPTVTVVGLGPAGPDLMTVATTAAIAEIEPRFLRTAQHPAATAVTGARGGATSFDHHYERAATIEDVYRVIVEDLVDAAVTHGRVLYAVPGSPAVAERTVELLRADPRVETEVIPALSCIDLAWVRLGVDPLALGARIVDGHRFAVEAAAEQRPGPLLVLQCDNAWVLSDIKLSVEDPPDEVVVLRHLGEPDEQVEAIAWADLDRVDADPLTSLWIPALSAPPARELARFAELVRTLREQCPWDRRQTHESLRPYLLEETYEVLDAIDRGDPDELEEELGDLLFQVFFHATLAAETGAFTLADVARGVHDKLVRRHPHVFGEGGRGGGEPAAWEDIKRVEKGRTSAVEGIPAALPALAYAQKLQKRAAGVGFDWPDVEGAWPKVLEEIAEVQAAAEDDRPDEIGDLLFACVNVARHLGVDAEMALRQAAQKFATRFAEVERLAAARGLALPGASLDALDRLWDEAKGLKTDPGAA